MAVRSDGRLQRDLDIRYRAALPGALTKAGMLVVTRTHRIFVVFRPQGWATGHMARSLTVSPPILDRGWLRVRIGPTVKYAYWVHFGRPPGKMPPVTPEYSQSGGNILDWVREKHIAGTYAIVGVQRGGYPRYKRLGKKPQRVTEDLQAAWAIAISIKKRGTKPFPFLIVGFRQSKQEALQVFRTSLLIGMAQSGR